MLDQETIRTFIQVAETGSFSRAASLLHKTPAAISYRIKTLEEQVATQLFLRTTRSVSLTLAGQHLLEHCRQWLNWLDVMPDELQQINAGVERQVNIVINNLLYQPQSAADLLTWLHQQFPFTRFQLSRQSIWGCGTLCYTTISSWRLASPARNPCPTISLYCRSAIFAGSLWWRRIIPLPLIPRRCSPTTRYAAIRQLILKIRRGL